MILEDVVMQYNMVEKRKTDSWIIIILISVVPFYMPFQLDICMTVILVQSSNACFLTKTLLDILNVLYSLIG